MESVMFDWQAWAAYAGFALVGLWCWDKLFFWLNKKGDARRLVQVLGAALLLAPVYVSNAESYFAPAIFVLILDLLGGMHPLSSPALFWLLATCCIGVLLLGLTQLLIRKKKAS